MEWDDDDDDDDDVMFLMFLIPTFCRTDFLTVETQKFTVIIFAKISWCEVFDYTINSTNKRKRSNKSSAWNVIIIHFFTPIIYSVVLSAPPSHHCL